MANTVDVSIEDLARAADLNIQTIYRKTGEKKFGSKSTRKLLSAIESFAAQRPIDKAVG